MDTRNRCARLMIAGLYLGLLAFVSLSAADPYEDVPTLKKMANNLAHIPAYAVLMFLLIRCFEKLDRKTMVVSFLIAFSFGSLMEILQAYVPYRFPSVTDALLNATGAIIVLVLFERGILKWGET